MPTVTLALAYRPVRLGFIVREGQLTDVGKAAGIATLLCGGIHNPLIPVGTDNQLADSLINHFGVDALCPVERSPEIDAFLLNHRDLYRPHDYARNVFYENLRGQRASIGYLDAMCLIDKSWEADLKHAPKGYRSNAVHVAWATTDPQTVLLAASFGHFPDEPELRDDFKAAFRTGLRANQTNIRRGAVIPASIEAQVTPILWTGHDLLPDGGHAREPGVYVGRSTDCEDIINFWNLRAAGEHVVFLPVDCTERFAAYVQAYLVRIDELPSRWGDGRPGVLVYHRVDRAEVDGTLIDFPTKKGKAYWHIDSVTLSGLNVRPSSFLLQRSQVLAAVDPSFGRFQITAALPEKKFIVEGRQIGSQELITTVRSLGEYEYEHHTIIPPNLPALNVEYSRAIAMRPDDLRVGHEHVGLRQKVQDSQLRLYPMPHQDVIEKVFAQAGIEPHISQTWSFGAVRH